MMRIQLGSLFSFSHTQKQILLILIASLAIIFLLGPGPASDEVKASSQGDLDLHSAVEYDADADDNSGDIEVAFSHNISQNSSRSDGITSENVTVYLNGVQYAVDGSTFSINQNGLNTGRVIITGSKSVDIRDDFKVRFNTIGRASGLGDGYITPGNVTVTTTSTTVDVTTAGDEAAYEGEKIALKFPNENNDFEITNNGSFYFAGVSGENSVTFVWDTDSYVDSSTTDEWNFTDTSTFGTKTIELRVLDLSVSIQKQEFAKGEDIEGGLSANAGNRQAEIRLYYESNTTLAKTVSTTLDASGQASFSFSSPGEEIYYIIATDQKTGNNVQTKEFTWGDVPAAFNLTVNKGETYLIGMPGPINGSYDEVFGHIDGALWLYNAKTGEWRQPNPDENIEPLDAVYLLPEEDASIKVEIADSETGVGAPGEKSVYEGWNLIASPQYSKTESAFVANTGEPKRILQIGNPPGNEPFASGESFGWYAFGQDSSEPRVSAFTGYWLYMAENGTIGSNLYKGVSYMEAKSLLNNTSG